MSALGYLDGMIQQMIRANHFNYSEDAIAEYLDQYIFQDLRDIRNHWNQRIKCTLVRHRNEDDSNKGERSKQKSKCIVYLHGYGSIRLQSLNVLKFLPQDYYLCMFDMSGSGKSEGELITYGIKESYDIEPVISFLDKNKNIEEFVLWGRSMGAVASLLYAIREYSSISLYQSRESTKDRSIKECEQVALQASRQPVLVCTVVLDSAFYNFRDIAKEMAVSRMSIPSFIVNIAINYVQKIFTRVVEEGVGKEYNPFNINFKDQINLSIPILVVYSSKDEVVPPIHSQMIMRNIKSKFQKIMTDECSHNQARSAALVSSIFQKIIKYDRQKKRLQEKKHSNSLISKDSLYSNCCKRGIFVFTPSKQKEKRTGSVNSLMSSIRSTTLKHELKVSHNPKRSKIVTKRIQDKSKQLIIEPICTDATSLIVRKLQGIRQCESASIRKLRSKKLNMQIKRQQKTKRANYFS